MDQFQQFQQQSQAQHRYNDQQFQQQMERDAQQQFQQQMERDADAMRRRRKRAWWDLGGPAETADPSLSLETVRVKITLAERWRKRTVEPASPPRLPTAAQFGSKSPRALRLAPSSACGTPMTTRTRTLSMSPSKRLFSSIPSR